MLLALFSDPTIRLPTETVDEAVGKLWAAPKLVELGAKITTPAVFNDMRVESIRPAVVIVKSPPV
jgi:hypothetical protein